MSVDILEGLEAMRFTRLSPADENEILKLAKDEIVRLRGEVADRADDLTTAYMAGRYDGKTIAPAEAKGDGLWCLHVLGPDEVHAAPSKAHAEQAVAIFNATFPHGDGEVRVEAVVAPWPHSAESHAASVADFIPNWLLPRWQVEALTKGTPQPADGEAVAWRFRIDDDPNLHPFWTKWSADESFRKLMGERGYGAAEYAYTTPPAAQVLYECPACSHHNYPPRESAHPSACELGAVRGLVSKWRIEAGMLLESAGRAARRDDGTEQELRQAASDAEMYAGQLEQALGTSESLQHRGDSRGGEGS